MIANINNYNRWQHYTDIYFSDSFNYPLSKPHHVKERLSIDMVGKTELLSNLYYSVGSNFSPLERG